MHASEHEIDLFGPELDRFTYNSGVDNVTYTGLPVSDSLLAERAWHITSYPSFVRKQKYDVVLFPAGTRMLPLKFEATPVVVVQEILSELYRTSDEGLITNFFKMQLKKVPLIIAATRFIRDDLVNLGIPESRIAVIYNGIDTSLFYPRSISSNEAVLIHPFSIRRPYIIYASRVAYPGKCHVELIKAFALFKEKTGLPHRLVLAGSDGVNAEVVHREVLRSPVASDILLTGYFPHQNLPELYSAADACIFPSATEGVGLPVLEALACGVPVGCARAGALPEMAGDSVLYFDPERPQEIADTIQKLIKTPGGENDTLRSDLAARSVAHVQPFSWDRCARETVDKITALKH